MSFTNTATLSAATNPTLYPQTQAVTLVTTTTDGTTSINSADQQNTNCKGVVVSVNVSAATGTSPTTTVTIQGKDNAGNYYTILASTALAGVAATQLTVYPGAAATNNISANTVLPNVWRVNVAIGGTTPAITSTVTACLIP